jgi:3-hydroxybutyryl-CoA dehydrogenase
MKIIVVADIEMQKEFESKGIPEGVEVHFETALSNINSAAEAIFYLEDESLLPGNIEAIENLDAPVFVSSVVTTLKELPQNAIRLNGWSGFLQRPIIEISASDRNLETGAKILESLNWKYQLVPDTKGMIAAKVISMIVNEAYFALGDDVSTKQDIDTAMKLGTNYPYGPFEWSEKIGLKKIYNLLTALSEEDKRYMPAPHLSKEVSQ